MVRWPNTFVHSVYIQAVHPQQGSTGNVRLTILQSQCTHNVLGRIASIFILDLNLQLP